MAKRKVELTVKSLSYLLVTYLLVTEKTLTADDHNYTIDQVEPPNMAQLDKRAVTEATFLRYDYLGAARLAPSFLGPQRKSGPRGSCEGHLWCTQLLWLSL